MFLRPRFQQEVPISQAKLFERFYRYLAHHQRVFYYRRSEHRLLIDLLVYPSYFWTPHLQLELIPLSKNHTLVKGRFGPKPEVWNFFVFGHVVLGLGLAVALMAYVTSVHHGESTVLAKVFLFVIPMVWILFYAIGRLGRRRARAQKLMLQRMVRQVLEGVTYSL